MIEALVERADAHAAARNYPSAMADYEEALRRDPGNSAALLGRGDDAHQPQGKPRQLSRGLHLELRGRHQPGGGALRPGTAQPEPEAGFRRHPRLPGSTGPLDRSATSDRRASPARLAGTRERGSGGGEHPRAPRLDLPALQ
jgi:hypothetical protein